MRSQRRWRRLGRMAVVGSALALVLAGCGSGGSEGGGSSESDGTPQRGGTVTVDWVANPTSLDPLKYNVFGTYNLVGLVYNTLYRWTEDGGLENELATAEPTVSKDGLTVTIPVREGVSFHDGSALSAEDVAFTIETVLDPANASIWFAGLSPITEVAVPDERTVVLTLSRRHDVLAGILAQIPILSSEQEYLPSDTYAQTMMGTGPFKFVTWDQGVQVKLERNDDYFVAEQPYLDGVVMRTVTEDAGRMANVATGSADIMPMVPFNQVENLKGRGVQVEVTPRSALMPTIFPSLKEGKPTANAAFRRAVAWAIDRGKLVDTVFKGVAEPASTVLADGTPNWDAELGGTYGDSADLDQAKAALAESGVKEGTEIELIVRNEPLSVSMGTVIQANLRELGLDATLSPQESAAYLPKLVSGDFDLMMLSIEAGLSSGYTPMYAFSAMHSESSANYTGFADEELDRLLVEAIGAPADPAAAWRAVQERELEVVPLIPTVTARYVEAYSNRLKGHTASSLFSLRDLDRSWIED
ncbi:ABC transporter substrate-binding protein [Nocardioides pantholopis]|uniref:ABC transporter substrate-binding protein n=1 Tax=Nocardioides pantholopis TaxID=2483798 RepID=UPI000F075604|nr:ABC transporter substrate-binding protein [Nocardioides pantholopis]